MKKKSWIWISLALFSAVAMIHDRDMVGGFAYAETADHAKTLVSSTKSRMASHRDTATIEYPLDERINWTNVGFTGDIPHVETNIINVMDIGAMNDGITDNAQVIQTAINGAETPAVFFFPEGHYRMESSLDLKSGMVLRGEGSEQSHLEFFSSSGCIRIHGSNPKSYVAVLGGMEQGSSKIVISDASGFTIGGGARIQQDDIVPPQASWGAHAAGQMVEIVAIHDNTLTIRPPLHLPYRADNNPQITPVNFIENVGVEDLHIKRMDSGASASSNISLRRAANCWIQRVESEYTERYHIAVAESLHCEVRDSFIHHAKSKGDGGQGYGVSLAYCTTSVLVENNIFHELRHAMIAQIGVNGCVFGYNYVEGNYSDDGWDKTYISLHGHYPYMNLFEGNIVGWIGVGDYWGPIGPGNTFLRNRLKTTDEHEGNSRERGVWVRFVHGAQNIIGNEFTHGSIVFRDEDGTHMGVVDYGEEQAKTIVNGNNVKGQVVFDPTFIDTIIPDSLYLFGKPAFFGTLQWPSLGGDQALGGGTIPAYERWKIGDFIPQPGEEVVSPVPPVKLRIIQKLSN